MKSMGVALLCVDAFQSIFFHALKPPAHKFSASRIRGLDALAITIGVISRMRTALGHRQRSLRGFNSFRVCDSATELCNRKAQLFQRPARVAYILISASLETHRFRDLFER
jgi:hypothetical protein